MYHNHGCFRASGMSPWRGELMGTGNRLLLLLCRVWMAASLSGLAEDGATTSSSSKTVFGFPLYPPFQLNQPRFPQQTFKGRYLHYLDVIDPRTLFASKEKMDAALSLLDAYRRDPAELRQHGVVTNAQLWEAQKLRNAVFHPDTGERIPAPFRMSGFVPFGWITVTGMLLPNPSWPTLLFWQWANQSHNACVNFANRNATKPQPLSTYVRAYTAAVGAALSVSASLTWLIRRSERLSAARKLIIQRFVPLPATSFASTLNVLCMRAPELKSGIDVADAAGQRVGTSHVAAKQAVIDTALTRAFLPVPLLALPPCIMPFFERLKSVQRNVRLHLLLNALVCTISFAVSLPVALALFPQQSSISADMLEPEIRKECARRNLQTVYYNRGM